METKSIHPPPPIDDDATTVPECESEAEIIPEIKKKEISNKKIVELILIDTLLTNPNLWFMKCGHIWRPYFRPVNNEPKKEKKHREELQYNPYRYSKTPFPKLSNEEISMIVKRISDDINEKESNLTYKDPSGVIRRPYFRKSLTAPVTAVKKAVIESEIPIQMPIQQSTNQPANKLKRKILETFTKFDEEEDEYIYYSQVLPIIPVIKKPKIKVASSASSKPAPSILPPVVIVPVPLPASLAPPPPPPPQIAPIVAPIIEAKKIINCRYMDKCSKRDCIFTHPLGYIPQPVICNNDTKCCNQNCKYRHSNGYIPKPFKRCKFGIKCNFKENNKCFYSHPDDVYWSAIKN
jgi:hypothetical protein